MLYFLILCAVILAAVLLRSHYENTHFTRAYYLYKSRKIKDNIKIVFLSDLHESVFGRENQELADAIRLENPDYILLGGDLPSPTNLPDGCAFHTRCPYATDRCRQERPELTEREPGHFVACHLAKD